ncbi:hypothetical protein LTS08_004080 [Lithohypha guttulata]|nr:hypothetical protein LTS08_004080 [Lithohypha guttulata]
MPRILPDAVLRITSPQGPQPIVIKIPSRHKHLIPLYIFIPPTTASLTADDLELSVLVDFHGGGFVLGHCHEQAPFCAKLCRELNCVAISVDYRLGPYAQFPAALEDAEDVINAILKPELAAYNKLRSGINDFLSQHRRPIVRLNTNRIALSGFSSGGNLALNLVMNIGPPELPELWPSPFPADYPSEIPVLMYYATIDMRELPSVSDIVAGFHDVPRSFIVRLELEKHLLPAYLSNDKNTNPRASPGLADVENDGLHSRARCLLVLAEMDTLSLQNEIWLQKVRDAGREKDVSIEKFLGVTHGWTQFPDSWLDADALSQKYEAQNKAVDFARGYWKVS